MRRREFISLLGGAAAGWPLAVRSATLPEVAILDPGIPQHFDAFRQGMRDLGYVESRNVHYIYRFAEGRAEPITQLASELVALKPNVIVTVSALPVRAVKEATSTIPIVFVIADAVAAGAVSNLAHPGGNITGFSFLNTELSSKRLELLLEMLPTFAGLRSCGILIRRGIGPQQRRKPAVVWASRFRCWRLQGQTLSRARSKLLRRRVPKRWIFSHLHSLMRTKPDS
jgi:ABC-type uncharacterized transport system substrate-binding protein